MSKRKTGIRTVKDTGIYRRTFYQGGPPPALSPEEGFEKIRQQAERLPVALDDLLNRCESWALETLEPFAVEDSTPGAIHFPLCCGAGAYKVPQEAPELIHDARELIGATISVRHCKGDVRILQAVALGRIIERLHVRGAEPLAKIGRKRREAGAKSAAVKNRPYARERGRYQTVVDRYVREGHSYNRAVQLAAQNDFKAGTSTLRKYTVNRNPANRGRQK